MFEMPQGMSEAEGLKKFKASRSTDSQEQPEKPDVVNVSEDAPIESEEVEAQAETVADEVEESEVAQAQEEEAQDEEGDLFYYEIDGEEVSSQQIKEWKSKGLMQSDYTQKTQALSEERKSFEEERNTFNAQQSELSEKLALVEAMIQEDTPSAETLAEWREYEPEKLLDYQEKQAKRKELLESAKQVAPQSNFDAEAEHKKLWDANPQWVDNGKPSKAFEQDSKLIQDYANEAGYSSEEFSTFGAKHIQTLLDAAKFKAAQKSNASVTKKVRKAPVSTKPKAQAQSSVKSEIDAMRAKVKKYGRPEDFVKLRKLERQS